MESIEIVKTILQQQGKTNADFANGLNITQATAWDRLNTRKANGVTVKKLIEMLRYLNYDLIILPRGRAGKLDGAYIITEPKEDKK